MFGFIDTQQENRVIINHLLLIFEFNVDKLMLIKSLSLLLTLYLSLVQFRALIDVL